MTNYTHVMLKEMISAGILRANKGQFIFSPLSNT